MDLRKFLLILLVLFLLYFLVTAPVQLAHVFEAVGRFLEDVFDSLVRFFHSLRRD
jgi:hypothetical protein